MNTCDIFVNKKISHIALELLAMLPGLRYMSSIPNVVSSSKTNVEPGTVDK